MAWAGGGYRNGSKEGEWIEFWGYEGDEVEMGPYVDDEKHGSWVSCFDGLENARNHWIRGELRESLSYGRGERLGDRKVPCPVPVGDSR